MEQNKTLTFSQIRANKIIAMAKDFRENENLSYGDANKKATLIDSYTCLLYTSPSPRD